MTASPLPDQIPAVHRDSVASFLEQASSFGRYDDPLTVDALLGVANQLADDLLAWDGNGTATAVLTPGNSTRYLIAVTDLGELEALTFSGRYLISLPLQRRCAALTLGGVQTAGFIKDLFGLARDDEALLYAGVLSLLGDRLP